jgi:hypothetical protein
VTGQFGHAEYPHSAAISVTETAKPHIADDSTSSAMKPERKIAAHPVLAESGAY